MGWTSLGCGCSTFNVLAMLVMRMYLLIKLYSAAIAANLEHFVADLDRPQRQQNNETDADDDHLCEVVPDGRLHTSLQRHRGDHSTGMANLLV